LRRDEHLLRRDQHARAHLPLLGQLCD
jgi:hypothetical protein